MGYRTNQCQSCGGFGHNRRGCPQIKEAHARIERLAQKYGVILSEDDRAYASTSWIERINEAAKIIDASEDEVSWRDRWHWEEIETRKIAQAAKIKRGRKCGFCDERGHNARTCESKKQHRKDADAMQGLAHRFVAACMEKAGIVPGALMRYRDWDHQTNDYANTPVMVMGIDWNHVAEPGYDTHQGIPRHLDMWFREAFIKVKMRDGFVKRMRLPQDIAQQTSYNYHETPSNQWGLLSPVHGGTVNKDSGWMGDNVTMISPAVPGVYSWRSNAETTSDYMVDRDLGPVLDELLAAVGTTLKAH